MPDGPVDDPDDQRAWAALQTFVSLKGTADVPSRVRVHGFDLGRWVADRRVRYSAGLLPPADVVALEVLPGWRWSDPRPEDWAAFRRALIRYVEHRHTQTKAHGVIPEDATYDGYRIGVWAGQQRTAYTTGALTPSRIAWLEQVPGWMWTEPDPWDRGLALLRRYLQETGDPRIADDLVIDEFPLGRWVARLRADQRRDELPAAHIEALEALPGWQWEPEAEQTPWDRGWAVLADFAARTGAADPAQHVHVDGYPVGMWANTQRQRYRTGVMPAAQAQALTSLPGWFWSARDHAWQRGYSALQRYLDQCGRLPGLKARCDGYPVGEWAGEQRSRYRVGKLAPDRVAALEALPNWVWTAGPGARNTDRR